MTMPMNHATHPSLSKGLPDLRSRLFYIDPRPDSHLAWFSWLPHSKAAGVGSAFVTLPVPLRQTSFSSPGPPSRRVPRDAIVSSEPAVHTTVGCSCRRKD